MSNPPASARGHGKGLAFGAALPVAYLAGGYKCLFWTKITCVCVCVCVCVCGYATLPIALDEDETKNGNATGESGMFK